LTPDIYDAIKKAEIECFQNNLEYDDAIKYIMETCQVTKDTVMEYFWSKIKHRG
jgi:hypothetical protein